MEPTMTPVVSVSQKGPMRDPLNCSRISSQPNERASRHRRSPPAISLQAETRREREARPGCVGNPDPENCAEEPDVAVMLYGLSDQFGLCNRQYNGERTTAAISCMRNLRGINTSMSFMPDRQENLPTSRCLAFHEWDDQIA